MNKIINRATAKGIHNDLETIIHSNENTIFLLDKLGIEKSANKTFWAIDTLTYTIKITNPSSAHYNDIIIKDILEPKLITLIIESIRINNVPISYGMVSYIDGVLIINLPSISSKETIVIEFQVIKRNCEVFKLDNYATISFSSNNISKSNIVTVFGISSVCRCKESQKNFIAKNKNH